MMKKCIFFFALLLTIYAFMLAAPAKHHVLFAHGFSGSKMSAFQYTKGHEKLVAFLANNTQPIKPLEHYLFDAEVHELHTFNFPDVHIDLSMNGSIPDLSKANFAQRDDINTLHRTLETTPAKHLIGFGVSRGAATWLTTLGTQKISKTIGALVLESPFTSTQEIDLYIYLNDTVSTLKSIIPTLNIKQTCKNLVQGVFGGHDIDGISPIQTVKSIPKTIPIMLVHSAEDRIIPLNHTRVLYVALKKQGHNHVYLVELDQGSHAKIIRNPDDALPYCKAVHAFFKKYSLPYNTTWAEGVDLQTFQPSIKTVLQRIEQTEKPVLAHSKLCSTKTWSTTLNIT